MLYRMAMVSQQNAGVLCKDLTCDSCVSLKGMGIHHKHKRGDVVKTCSWTSQLGSKITSGLKMTHTDANKTGWSHSGTMFWSHLDV